MTVLIISLAALYVIIAASSALMTYCEQQDNKIECIWCKTFGFVACALWPVTLVSMATFAGAMSVQNKTA